MVFTKSALVVAAITALLATAAHSAPLASSAPSATLSDVAAGGGGSSDGIDGGAPDPGKFGCDVKDAGALPLPFHYLCRVEPNSTAAFVRSANATAGMFSLLSPTRNAFCGHTDFPEVPFLLQNHGALYGTDPGTDEPMLYAFLLEFETYYTLFFRGTSTSAEWTLDAEVKKVAAQPDFPGQIHAGFSKVFRTAPRGMASMADQLRELLDGLPTNATVAPKQLLVGGHSLGSAIATLAAYVVANEYPHFDLAHITFASPRVGDATFADAFDGLLGCKRRSFRIQNSADAVPNLPPAKWGYKHVCDEEAADVFDMDLGNKGDNHVKAYHMHVTYENAEEKLHGGPAACLLLEDEVEVAVDAE